MHAHLTSHSRKRALASALGVLLCVVTMLWASSAWAAKVIPPGKEADIAALLVPHTLGEVVEGGVRLENMRVDRDRIELVLGSEDSTQHGTLVLRPLEPEDEQGSESFSFSFAGDEGTRPAADALMQAVRANDRGGIYVAIDEAERPPPSVVVVEGTVSEDPSEPIAEEEDVEWSGAGRARYLAKVAGLAALWFALCLGWRVWRRSRASWRDEALAAGASVAAVTAVAAYAWICDDAHISMRYAWNLANGHGLVFNVGERVQGYTNPLWTLALALLASAQLPMSWGAVSLGVGFSALTVTLLWFIVRELWRVAGEGEGSPPRGAGPGLAFVVLLVLCYGSQPLLAFSSAGLEGSITHLLVAACLAAALSQRVGLVLFLSALALFNRLDTAPLLFPLAAWGVWSCGADMRARLRRCWPGLFAGVLVLGGWLVFATLYYGYPMPNTWYAKGGMYLGNGMTYLWDLIEHRPSSAVVLLGGPVLLLRKLEQPCLRAVAIGCLLQVAYVVYVGGDYMHGRFWTAPLLLASVTLVVAAEQLGRDEPRWRWLAPTLALLTLVDFARPHAPGGAVVIERDPDYSAWTMGLGDVDVEAMRVGHDVVPELREGLTIAHALIAHVDGSDPRIMWIDGYGLTDPYIARCPALDDSRAGHFVRPVPRAYLRARGELGQIDDGRARLAAGDPGLWAELEQLRAEPRWTSEIHRQRFEELRLLTRGPIFAPERLRLIPRYLVSRQTLPALPPEHTVDLMLPGG